MEAQYSTMGRTYVRKALVRIETFWDTNERNSKLTRWYALISDITNKIYTGRSCLLLPNCISKLFSGFSCKQFHVVSKIATCGWIDLISVEAINDIIDEYNENKSSKYRALNHTAATGYWIRENIVNNNSLRTTRWKKLESMTIVHSLLHMKRV